MERYRISYKQIMEIGKLVEELHSWLWLNEREYTEWQRVAFLQSRQEIHRILSEVMDGETEVAHGIL